METNIQVKLEDKYQRRIGFVVFLVIVVALGYYLGVSGINIDIIKSPFSVRIVNNNPLTKDVDLTDFWAVWDKAIAGKSQEEEQKIYYASMMGMVASLEDPYTSFLPPVINQAVKESINGTYQGIGAELGFKEEQLIVVSPLDGSPAKAAGVRAGDKILAIDGLSTKGISLNEAVSKIRGDAGTTVTLTLQHDEEAPKPIAIKRANITVASVTWSDKGEGVAYLRVSRFGQSTNAEWSKAVSDINTKMKELDSVIVDVRGNPGGYLVSAVYLAREFYKDKAVVWQEDSLGNQEPVTIDRNGAFYRVPSVFVLVDKGSASASEILAASLKEEFGAKLVGVTSFGKGTIQEEINFKDSSGMHITTGKWLTPLKNWVHKQGLTPDYVVERTDDDINAGKDPQLDKAVELAKQGI